MYKPYINHSLFISGNPPYSNDPCNFSILVIFLVPLRSTGPPRSLASLYGKLNCLLAKWDLNWWMMAGSPMVIPVIFFKDILKIYVTLVGKRFLFLFFKIIKYLLEIKAQFSWVTFYWDICQPLNVSSEKWHDDPQVFSSEGWQWWALLFWKQYGYPCLRLCERAITAKAAKGPLFSVYVRCADCLLCFATHMFCLFNTFFNLLPPLSYMILLPCEESESVHVGNPHAIDISFGDGWRGFWTLVRGALRLKSLWARPRLLESAWCSCGMFITVTPPKKITSFITISVGFYFSILGFLYSKEVLKSNFRQYGQMEKQVGRVKEEKNRSEKIREEKEREERRCRCAKR